MRVRPSFLLLAGVMGLSLAACKTVDGLDPSGPAPTQAPTSAPTPTPEPVHTVVVYPPDVPVGDYAPWQTAYADFLAERLEMDARIDNGDVSDMYCLYDADEDGTPELFIRYGMAEAGSHTTCYAFRDGRVEALRDGDFPSGHGGIYTCPGEKAFLFCWGHMGYAEISKVPMEDGRLGKWELLLEEDTRPSANGGIGRPYTDPAELVPGSEPLSYYYTRSCRDWGRNIPLTLPIYDYEALPRLLEAPLEEAEVRTAVGEVLWGNRAFYSYSGDNFHGRPGYGILAEYLMGGAYPGRNRPLIPREYAFVDVNGDGQTDCVLRLEEEPDEYGNISQYYVVFHVWEGEVHAYFFAWMDGLGVDPDGTVYFRKYGSWEQVSFYGDQCYTYPARRDPAEGADLAWDEFTPNP